MLSSFLIRQQAEGLSGQRTSHQTAYLMDCWVVIWMALWAVAWHMMSLMIAQGTVECKLFELSASVTW